MSELLSLAAIGDPLKRLRLVREACRRAAMMIAEFADLDPAHLLGGATRGGTEESYWAVRMRYLVRVVCDAPEADLARVLDLHHSTIASACHAVEDDREASSEIDETMTWLEQRLRENFERGRRYRDAIEHAIRKQKAKNTPEGRENAR